jgi:hypothetical protein
MKMYDYLVAYNFEADGYLTHSTGTMCVSRKNKINSFEEVASLVKFITEQIPGAKNVSVYNFILLGRNEH